MTKTNTRQASKVVVIGLDCAEPSLVFDRYAHRLPYLSALRERGVWGKLRSCDPPITVPAWMSMMSSKDPGTLGYYGFRNRADHSYEKMTTATSLGWMTLVLPLGTILPRAVATTSISPRQAQSTARAAKAMIDHLM